MQPVQFGKIHTHKNEVEDYFKLTKTEDRSCLHVFWWRNFAPNRFPHIEHLTRDILMIMVSYVPSVSAFSYSGDLASATRASTL